MDSVFKVEAAFLNGCISLINMITVALRFFAS